MLRIKSWLAFSIKFFLLSLIFFSFQGIPVFAKSTAKTNLSLGISPQLCIFKIKAYPEKRIPRTKNWSTELRVQITNVDSSIPIYDFKLITDDETGQGEYDFCKKKEKSLVTGNYDFYLTGFSHLIRKFPDVEVINYKNEFELDLSNPELLAGETSVIYDNKINSLDISTQIKTFYSDSSKNDLNQDGKVNTLDISNTIYNFYKLGD